jgi:hypothetical protein
MTNASALNAEATPYNQARNSQENVTDNRTRNFRGTEWGYHMLFTSERHGGPASSVQTFVDSKLEWKCYRLQRNVYWIIKSK